MSHRCTHKDCYPDTTCALGHLDRTKCEHWKQALESEIDASGQPATTTSDIPWNGYSLGTRDLAILAGRGCPRVIGLIGPPGAGKTSLLAFLDMWLLRHGALGEWLFAGSWTLGGWESVVQHCRWTGEPPPSFPPHTSSSGRHPGILHLALRNSSGALRDFLFTDAPGEWFTLWARVPMDPTASGARWVIANSDALLLLVDSASLANADSLPQSRRATRDLVERLSAHRKRGSLFVAWAKDDVRPPDAVRETLHRAFATHLPDAEVLRTTVDAPATIEKCFLRAIASADSSSGELHAADALRSTDPFLAFRGVHVSHA